MGHTASFRDARSDQCLVTTVVIAYQCAAPSIQELLGMPGSAAFGEIEDHRLHGIGAGAAVAPEVSAMRLAVARLEHLDRCFIGMQDRLRQQFSLDGIDQRL